MRIGAVVASVGLAALAANLAWFLWVLIDLSITSGSLTLDATVVPIFLVGTLTATVVVTVIGLPVGFGVAWLLRKAGLERGWTYPLAGAIVGAALAMPIGFLFEFSLSGAVAGLILGLAWWRLVRAPQLQAAVYV